MRWRTTACVVGAVALLGCEERAPAVPTRDSGPRARDGGDVAQIDGGYRRPDGGPRLPPADLEVTLPYGGPEARVPLEVGADLGTLDVFLSIDTTGSFGGEIDALQRDLIDGVVPTLAARVPSVALGVGRFEDFPAEPFGTENDRPFQLVTAITTDRARVGSALASLDAPLGDGGDLPESGAEALWQIATGEGYTHDGRTWIAPFRDRGVPGGGDVGGAGFRARALRVVVHVTDATSHAPGEYEASFPGTRSLAQAAEALRAIDARVIGIASGPAPRSELEALALRTGAVVPPVDGSCSTGIEGAPRGTVEGTCPLVFDVAPDGTGLSTTLVDAIGDLLDTVQWNEVWGEADDEGLGFVRAVAAIEARVEGGAAPPTREDRRPSGDGVADTFAGVRPGTSVRFELVLRNTTVAPADYEQVFRVSVRILGDGLDLVERTVRVIVPRGRLVDGGVDSGA
ncbi:hypothetical protein [Sandaracinus amylolyticus]|uniref:hypothetical protein n=1 Tax=Sandaracinus amylolyticus TaxID=927083 RepID=UPI0014700EA2|nr:hypothetical protein [Sandaracinus amylolyticus]